MEKAKEGAPAAGVILEGGDGEEEEMIQMVDNQLDAPPEQARQCGPCGHADFRERRVARVALLRTPSCPPPAAHPQPAARHTRQP